MFILPLTKNYVLMDNLLSLFLLHFYVRDSNNKDQYFLQKLNCFPPFHIEILNKDIYITFNSFFLLSNPLYTNYENFTILYFFSLRNYLSENILLFDCRRLIDNDPQSTAQYRTRNHFLNNSKFIFLFDNFKQQNSHERKGSPI